jgi:hypothetical protein
MSIEKAYDAHQSHVPLSTVDAKAPGSRRSSLVTSLKAGISHAEDVESMKARQPTGQDYSGAHAKSDPEEIRLVKKLDLWIMVSLLCRAEYLPNDVSLAYPMDNVLAQLP